jgi:hypothetical protein
MAMSYIKSSPSSRIETWEEIRDIADGFCRLDISTAQKPLTIDDKIGPKLPTSEQCIRALTMKLHQPMPSSLVRGLQARIDQLRERMLISYTELISQMASLKEHTGSDDLDVQRKHSRGIETWFDQAVEELFAASTERPEVSIPIDIFLPRT